MVAAQFDGQLLGATIGEVGDKAARMLTIFPLWWRPRSDEAPKNDACARQFSDRVFATSDNPRHEAMEAIFADMKPGITADRCIRFKPDRRKAIALALKEAQKGDILLHCR
ncbi:MAG: hypothetical protein LBF34_02080 [Puniceicoccales bacterium]|nr:hypothetical protein [Puniceicoccales bacterium]